MEQTYSIEIIQPSDLENLSTHDNVIELTDVGIIGLDSLCRLCANRSDHLIPIYEGEGLEYQLEMKINRHFPFTVERNDTLPTHCCYQCASTLLSWHELIETSIEADRRLKALEFDTVVQFNHKLENLEEPPPEVIPDDITETLEENQENENVTDDTNATIDPQQRVAPQFRAAATTTDFLSFRQAQSNFTVDPKSTTTTLKVINNSESVKIENDHDIKKESSLGVIKTDPDEINVPCPKIIVKKKIKNIDEIKKEESSSEVIKTNPDEIKVPRPKLNVKRKLKNLKLKKQSTTAARIQKKRELNFLCDKKTEPCDLKQLVTTINSKKLLLEEENRKCSRTIVINKLNKEEIEQARVQIDKRTYYQCDECGKKLHSPYTYMWHRRIHTGERPYVCDLCGKQFRVSQGLVRHLRETHAGIKNFPCDICGRMFGTRRNVEEHRRIHTNERPYVCALCGKAFKQKASLFVHNRSHSDSFPHKCTYCGQGFRTKAPLLIHVTRHTGEKPYSCDVCGRCFRIKYELKGHKLIHSDEKPFSCTACGLSFRQKRYLRNHNKIKHNNQNITTVP